MTKKVKKPNEGLTRIQKELSQLRGAVIEMRKSAKLSSKSSSPKSSLTLVKAKKKANFKRPSEKDQKPLATKDVSVQPSQPKPSPSVENDSLAGIILQQAQIIEELRQELQQLKLHYERQVSTIKNNAKMLELQLQKLLARARKDRWEKPKYSHWIGAHYNNITEAVEELHYSSSCIKETKQKLSRILLSKTSSESDQKT
ncbi:hypothetical protein KR026_007784 [Drosophila bipectinata]|nr:hypothetical protein KR026_007784 [Drosophila bipectinata]